MSEITERLKVAIADRYVIERELGQGGMATVFLAHDVKHDRKVALKVLRPELAAVIGAERFLQEIKVTANLQHPNILPLYDSGETDTFLYYVMPYVEGETLRDKLKREKQLDVEETVEIARGIAAALQYAHERKIIHRDIKPENVLLQAGQPLVADFGIALAVSQAGGTRLTETGLSLGTPHYMSPEQATGDRQLDARSDIYSLGALVYEMLAGDPPHTGSTLQAVVAKVLSEEPMSITRVRTLVPANVDAAVHRALAKSPADRFRSAADFGAALANPGYTLSLPAGTAGVGSTPRGLGGWRLAVVLAGAVAVGGLVVRTLGRAPVAPAPVVRFSLGVRLGDVDFGSGIDISPDGTQLVFIGRSPDGRPGLYRRALDAATAVPVASTEGFALRSPTISPDGRMIAYTSQSQLRVTGLVGGSDQTIVPISPTSGGISWAPGDRIVFQPSFGSGLMVVSAHGGEPRALTRVDSGTGVDHRWPQVVPNGKWVLVTVWNGLVRSAKLAVASLETGEVRELIPGMFARYVDPGYLVFIGPDQSLQLVPFDQESGRVRGEPVAAGESVQVGGDGAAQFAVSRTGTIAYLQSLGRRVPVLTDGAGTVTLLPLAPALYMSPRFSPDGRALALEQSGGDVWIYDLDAGTFSRLTDGGGFYPLWTRDGRRILYSRDEQAEVNVYSVPIDRAEKPTSILTEAGQQRTQDLSPDGRHLLLRQNTGAGQYDLMVLDLDGGDALREWLASEFVERAATFSPDGRWVAYSSDESGREQVYVRPFPGPGGRTLVSSAGGTEPAWSPDGRRLYFRVADSVEVVDVSTTPTFTVRSRPRAVLVGSYYAYPWQRQFDVHPDGRRFLLLRNETDVTDMTVVVNWISGRLGMEVEGR